LNAIECNDNGKPPEQAGFDIMFSAQIVKYFAA
jgi:acyl-CoA reductase-like NAD-dependent aldehyde dehydrogenase